MTAFSIELPADTAAPALARRTLDERLPAAAAVHAATLRLLVSELVTNAVRHAGAAGAAVALRVRVDGRCVRVEVRDGGQHAERVRRRAAGAEGGYGLLLVERMASRWGVEAARGTCVWFEIDA